MKWKLFLHRTQHWNQKNLSWVIKEIEEKPLIEEIFLITFPFTYSSFYFLYSECRFWVNSENSSIDFILFFSPPSDSLSILSSGWWWLWLLCEKVIAFYNHLKWFFHFLLLLLEIIWISILHRVVQLQQKVFLFCFKIIHFTLKLSLYL